MMIRKFQVIFFAASFILLSQQASSNINQKISTLNNQTNIASSNLPDEMTHRTATLVRVGGKITKWVYSNPYIPQEMTCLEIKDYHQKLLNDISRHSYRHPHLRTAARNNAEIIGNYCLSKHEAIKSSLSEASDILAKWASGDELALSEHLLISDIITYLDEEQGRFARDYFIYSAIDRLENLGVRLINGGIIFSHREYDGYHRCSTRKHSWRADIDAIITNPRNVAFLYESLSQPIEASLYVDGEVRVDATATFRPSFKVFGSCVRIDKIRASASIPSIPLEAKLAVRVNLNPRILTPTESASGEYEIILLPTGTVQGEFERVGDFSVSADYYGYGTIGALVDAITTGLFNFSFGAFFIELGLLDIGTSKIEREIKSRVEAAIQEHTLTPISLDITESLGGHQVIKIGNLPLDPDLLAILIEQDGLPSNAFNDLFPVRDQYVIESFLYPLSESPLRTGILIDYGITQ